MGLKFLAKSDIIYVKLSIYRKNHQYENNISTKIWRINMPNLDTLDNNENISASCPPCVETENRQELVDRLLAKLQDKKAEDLIKRYELDKVIPVDLNELINDCNINLFPTDFSELENNPVIATTVNQKGAILGAVYIDNDIKILYKKDDPIHRQRFTIAHEIAHCCLNAHNLAIDGHIEYRTDLETFDPLSPEYKANVFAGELLVPESVLLSIYKFKIVPDIGVLSELFNVSKNVMKERLKTLGLNYKDTLRTDFS